MSIGPLGGIAGSLAGSPLAQTKGSETERAEQDVAVQQRRTDSDQKAEAAAGIGQADGEDHETAERDADGRRLWEQSSEGNADETEEAAEGDAQTPNQPQSKDTTGQSGNLLDLSG